MGLGGDTVERGVAGGVVGIVQLGERGPVIKKLSNRGKSVVADTRFSPGQNHKKKTWAWFVGAKKKILLIETNR